MLNPILLIPQSDCQVLLVCELALAICEDKMKSDSGPVELNNESSYRLSHASMNRHEF